jgi:heme exporter protein C
LLWSELKLNQSLPLHNKSALNWRWSTLAAPSVFYRVSAWFLPWLWLLFVGLTAAGLYIGFWVAPADATQGNAYRIIFIHVPAAWMSMLLYIAMAFWAGIGWFLNARMASMLARAIAPTGALFTLITLWSGALWGRPTWGTWWVWDARMTSELILLFLYLGFMALVAAVDDVRRGDRAGALLALVGVVNVPIIYFSVRWWNTLHQGASVSLMSAPKMASTMLTAMLLMTLAFWAYAFAIIISRARALVLEREAASHDWVKEVLK